MDGFTYEQTVGGWHVCDVCGVRVSHALRHQEWHVELLIALDAAAMGIRTLWKDDPRD